MTTKLASQLHDALGTTYRIEDELEGGGMSRLYLATQLDLNRRVVIKVLPPDLTNATSIARFKREIDFTVKLQHPNILPVLAAGSWEDILYYISPYILGESLRVRLDRSGRLPMDDVVRILREAGDALAYAHAQGVVHRDVKPGNILLSEGHAILADFGIARALTSAGSSSSLTGTGMVPGTPAYMAPEFPSDEQADVYALGVVGYEMLIGALPPRGVTTKHILERRGRVPGDSGAALHRVASVLSHALEQVPERRFSSTAELTTALVEVPAPRPWRFIVATAAAAALLILAVTGNRAWKALGGRAVVADSSRIAVLPFAGDAERVQPAGFVVEALLRWQGVTTVDQFQVADAIDRLPHGVRTYDDGVSVARDLGAGRFIRGQVTTIGDSLRVEAALFDVRSSRALHSVVARITRDPAGASRGLESLVDSLFIGADSSFGFGSHVSGTNSLPAVQAFVGGLNALEQWDLARADSLFALSVVSDPQYGRARLWQAQVRDWRLQVPSNWESLVDAAVADSARLSIRERQLATALRLLGRGDYKAACGKYATMASTNRGDFAAWFGLGRCQSLDEVVVADPRTPSRWAYRSSYHRAILAYKRAFEILPTAHRGFERGGFESLQLLLYTRSNRVRAGRALPPDTERFAALPTWQGDTLAFIPFPLAAVNSGAVEPIQPGTPEAFRRQRLLFHEIALGWARALPGSAGPAEALAMSLDLLDDAASIDTIRRARALAHDPAELRRLGALEALMRFKFAVPDRIPELEAALAVADSVLSAPVGSRPLDAHALVPIAALLGRCRLAGDLAERSATDQRGLIAIPGRLVGFSRRLAVEGSMGCAGDTASRAISELLNRIAATPEVAHAQVLVRAMLATQAAELAFPSNAPVLAELAKPGMPLILVTQLAVLRHDAAGAVDGLRRLKDTRRQAERMGGQGTTDAVLSEARAMLAFGDTTTAIVWLDSALTRIRAFPTGAFAANVAVAGATVSTMALRADVAFAKHDSLTARRWARAVAVLWQTSDPELRPTVARMSRIAKQ